MGGGKICVPGKDRRIVLTHAIGKPHTNGRRRQLWMTEAVAVRLRSEVTPESCSAPLRPCPLAFCWASVSWSSAASSPRVVFFVSLAQNLFHHLLRLFRRRTEEQLLELLGQDAASHRLLVSQYPAGER